MCHTSATTPMLKSAELGLPLRFRGSGAVGSSSTRRGALAVGVGVAGRHSSQEAGCVNPRRSGEHKVPRSRASSAGPVRGGVLTVVSASSLKQGIGFAAAVVAIRLRDLAFRVRFRSMPEAYRPSVARG